MLCNLEGLRKEREHDQALVPRGPVTWLGRGPVCIPMHRHISSQLSLTICDK